MSSGSSSGADQHLLALLRAIRLRQAAPDAVAAGVADTAEALREQEEAAQPHAAQPHAALPPGEIHEALPPATPRPGLAPPHAADEGGHPLRPRWASATPGGPGAGPGLGSGGTGPGPDRSGAGSGSGGAGAGSDRSGVNPAAGSRSDQQPLSGAPGGGRPGWGAAATPGSSDAAGGSGGASETEDAGGPTPGRSFWDRSSVRHVEVTPKFDRSGGTVGGAGADAGRAGAARTGPGAEWGGPESERGGLGGQRGGPGRNRGGASVGEAGAAGSDVATSGGWDVYGLDVPEHEPLLRPAELPPVDGAPNRSDLRSPVWTPLIDPTRSAARWEADEVAARREGGEVAARSEAGERAVGDPAGGDAADRDRPAGDSGTGESGAAAGKALATPDEAGRFADVEAVGRPNRNQFTGLPVRRVPGTVTPVVWPHRLEGNEVEGGARPEWASGGGHRVRDEGGFLHGESRTESGTRTPAPRLPGFELPHVMPPMVSRPPAGDGMDPADDALLRETQRLLATSLTFAGGPVEVAERLRAALLQAHPSLVTAVPGGAGTQSAQLARGLTWLVHHLDRPPALVEGTGRLGAALAACGVEPGHLQLVGAALAEAMRAGMAPGQWRQDFDLAWRSTWQHVYEWIAHGWARAGYEPPVWDATVVSHELRRPDLAVVRLRPSLPMPFRPGQYARIQLPGLPSIWRPYSLAGAPRRNDLVELHVRAKTTTGVSGALVHDTQVGDPVRISRAEGAMTLPADPGRNLLMIAGDTGVAPLKALLTELADTGDPRSAVLFWGVRDLDELYDIDEIAAVARAARRATVVPVVSEGDPGPYASGLVTDAVAAYGEWSDHEVYLAGPPLMLAATSLALQQLGVAPSRIHHDPPE